MRSDRFKYIKFNDVLNSVKSDLHVFDNNTLILEDRLLKVIYHCNEKLGLRLNKSKQILLEVKNGKADLPFDFYKIEMLFATAVTTVPNYIQLIPGNKAEYTTCPNVSNAPILKIDKMGCKDICCNDMFIVRQPQIQREIEVKTFIPLSMSKRCNDFCTNYSPQGNVRSEYAVDLEDNIIKTSFKEGQIFLCYIGTLEDEDGLPMIPFHPLLNEYYEWSLKKKILEDVFMNSEADVDKKLQYANQMQKDAYLEAWQFTGYPEYRELENVHQRYSQEFYNKWYKMFI